MRKRAGCLVSPLAGVPAVTTSPPGPTVSTLALLWQILFCHPHIRGQETATRFIPAAATGVSSKGTSPSLRTSKKSYRENQEPPQWLLRNHLFLCLLLEGVSLSELQSIPERKRTFWKPWIQWTQPLLAGERWGIYCSPVNEDENTKIN